MYHFTTEESEEFITMMPPGLRQMIGLELIAEHCWKILDPEGYEKQWLDRYFVYKELPTLGRYL